MGPTAASTVSRFAGRLCIPYQSRAGVISAKFRCIAHEGKCEGHVKYLGLDGVDSLLYNVNDFFNDKPYIALCEGEIDALTLSLLCDIPAIAVPGVSSWKNWHPRCFNGQYSQVFVFADADEAGREFAQKLIKGNARDHIPPLENAQIVYLDEGQDVNSTYVEQGAAELRRRAGLESV